MATSFHAYTESQASQQRYADYVEARGRFEPRVIEREKKTMNHRITREVSVDVELTPEECARMLAFSDTHFQARFLNELGQVSRTPVDGRQAWWEFQCCSLGRYEGVPEVSDDAKRALTTLQDYVCNKPVVAEGTTP